MAVLGREFEWGDPRVSSTLSAPGATRGVVHEALFYDDAHAYLTGVTSFLRSGGYQGRALVAVPGVQLELLRRHLEGIDDGLPSVDFADMTELGANPSRIIPTVRGFVDDHAQHAVRFVGEPIWAGRSDAEIDEATRHEALINVAFADTNAHILCPYDTRQLSDTVLADAGHTHPELITATGRRPSARYADPLAFSHPDRWPLRPRPAHAHRLDFNEPVQPREFVERHAWIVGLNEETTADLLLAVHEICANSLRHGPGHGTLHVWQTTAQLIVEVHDTGIITNSLAGRTRPTPDQKSGRGLYVAHQLCDLVEVRSSTRGTTVRLHVAH